MSRSFPDALRQVLEAIVIRSPAALALGPHEIAAGGAPAATMPGAPAPDPLALALQHALYQWAYCHGLAAPPPGGPPGGGDLTPLLRHAHPGRDRWSPGWQVAAALPGGRVLARKGPRSASLEAGQYVLEEAPGAPARPGARVAVFIARESVTWQPGFYFAFGDTLLDAQDDADLLRFYWNARAESAPRLLNELLLRLLRYQVPFRYKTLSVAAAYGRRDPAVLFVPRRFHVIATEIAAGVHAALEGGLEDDTPLFAKRLAPGLAVAEDPGNGESFGTHRCRLVAEAVVACWRKGRQDLAARQAEVAAAFTRAGLDVDRPHLGPRHRDDYRFPALED